MTTSYTKTEYNCATGESKQVELTPEEIAEMELLAVQAEAQRVEQEAIEAQKQADAQAGRDALLALGLTDAQINALLGA